MAAVRLTRQSVEAAQSGAFPLDRVRLTRQSVEVAQQGAYPTDRIRMTRQSIEVALVLRPSVPWQLIGQRTQEI